jgi:hypothetical protein
MAAITITREPGHIVFSSGIERIGSIIVPVFLGHDTTDEIVEISSGIFRWTRTVAPLSKDGPRLSVFTLDFEAAHPPARTMIPAVMYGENKWGSGPYYKGLTSNGVPWVLAYHRTSIPCATYSEGERWSVALYSTADVAKMPCSCSLVPGNGTTTHRLIWPEEEAPDSYLTKTWAGKGYATALQLPPDGVARVSATLCIQPVPDRGSRTRAWFHLVDTAWQANLRDVRSRYTPEQAWKLGIDYAKQYLLRKSKDVMAFCVGLLTRHGRWFKRSEVSFEQRRHFEIGWCGQNASLANSCLVDYVNNNEATSLDVGLGVLDWWVRVNGNVHDSHGLPAVRLNEKNGHVVPEHIADACNLGGMIEQFLEASQLAAKCGKEGESYRQLALDTCDAVVRLQDPSGKIGKSWELDGKVAQSEGSIAVFLFPGLIEAYKATKRERYLEAATRGFHFYIDEFLAQDFSTAGALDSYCVDKESAIPFVATALALYKLTKKQEYLDDAVFASQYLTTWQWHYSVPFPPESRLALMGYDSYGGTSVSVAHHHLDPYGVKFVNAWLELAQLTGNPVWQQRARAIWTQGLHGVADGTTPLSGITWPAGAQNEAAFQTWFGTRNDLSEWFVAWPTAFRLETLRAQPDWNAFS